ncbi:MAG: VWA domain-containing protein [Pseudomonadota bacterium]
MVTRGKKDIASAQSTSGDVAAFLDKARELGALRAKPDAKGRIIFALDATMSRQPTWDLACDLQAEMFHVVRDVGGLQVQLNYYRGFGECRSSKWVDDAKSLAEFMGRIACRGGRTQIRKVFTNARNEQKKHPVDALVFIGDAMEEDVDILCDKAGELGLLGVPIFIFQEGQNEMVERAFKEFARLSKGAYARFDANAAGELAALLKAVAVYATGGVRALEAQGDRLLLPQMRKG